MERGNYSIFKPLNDNRSIFKDFARFLHNILLFPSTLFHIAFSPEDTMKTIDTRERQTIKLASGAGEIHGICNGDIFLSRLKLLIIMAKAYLNGCPLGNFRKQAVMENSNHVFYQSLNLVYESTFSKRHSPDGPADSAGREKSLPVNKFRQRVQRLAVMTRAVARDRRTVDPSEKKALRDSLNAISKTLSFEFEINQESFLRAA